MQSLFKPMLGSPMSVAHHPGAPSLLSCLLALLVLPQVLRAAHFAIGHIGSMGRAKCHAEMTADGRYVAAGAADGQVSCMVLGCGSKGGGEPHQHDVAVGTTLSKHCMTTAYSTNLLTAPVVAGRCRSLCGTCWLRLAVLQL
jgi:hypothetical protein